MTARRRSPPLEKEMLPFGAETEHNVRQEVAHECKESHTRG